MVAPRQRDCQMCVFNPQPVLHLSFFSVWTWMPEKLPDVHSLATDSNTALAHSTHRDPSLTPEGGRRMVLRRGKVEIGNSRFTQDGLCRRRVARDRDVGEPRVLPCGGGYF